MLGNRDKLDSLRSTTTPAHLKLAYARDESKVFARLRETADTYVVAFRELVEEFLSSEKIDGYRIVLHAVIKLGKHMGSGRLVPCLHHAPLAPFGAIAAAFLIDRPERDDQAKTREPGAGSDVDWAVIAKLPCVAFYMGVKSLPRICAKLIENGMAPQTPAATIRWGTMPRHPGKASPDSSPAARLRCLPGSDRMSAIHSRGSMLPPRSGRPSRELRSPTG